MSPDIIRSFYLGAIDAAKDSIKLVNPYLTLNRKLKKALKNAVKRGVKVEIMISQHSDIPLTPDCVFYNAHKLMKKGADIWVYQPGFHHTKIIMVDGKFCTVGSANLNARSLRWDYEENAVILDSHTTAELERMFDADKKRSVYLTEEVWDEMRSPWKKFVGWFAHLLAPFLSVLRRTEGDYENAFKYYKSHYTQMKDKITKLQSQNISDAIAEMRISRLLGERELYLFSK